MFGRSATLVGSLCLAGCATGSAETATPSNAAPMQRWADTCKPWDDWDKPAAPYRIHGNTYYVGTCGIASILVTSDSGHVLIDSGTRQGAEAVLSNIKRLGIDPSKISYLLSTHEHFDHVGGLAYLAKSTGAKVVASPKAAPVLETGKDNPDDPQYGLHDPMEPVEVDHVIEDGQKLRLDSATMVFTPIFTPGHTPGALSWRWTSCDGANCPVIIYADSLSPVSRDGYQFSDYPDYVRQYRAGIRELQNLECDILLTPHPSHSKMIERAKTGTLEGGTTCEEYADLKTQALDQRLAKEAETAGQ